MELNLGSRTLPDAALPKLQTIFGGTTPVETRDAIRLWVWMKLHTEFMRERRARKSRELVAANEVTLQAQDAADAADFPEGLP